MPSLKPGEHHGFVGHHLPSLRRSTVQFVRSDAMLVVFSGLELQDSCYVGAWIGLPSLTDRALTALGVGPECQKRTQTTLICGGVLVVGWGWLIHEAGQPYAALLGSHMVARDLMMFDPLRS